MIHCGFVGLLGLPNAGKSSLMNALIEEKVSIVSSKPQTTRQALSGVWSGDDFQVIFFDAPGFVQKKSGLFEFLVSEFEKVIEKSDLLLFLVSHEQKESEEFARALDVLKSSGKPFHVVFSKSDLEATGFVKKMQEELTEQNVSHTSLSVLNKEGLAQFRQWFLSEVKKFPAEHHPLYDPDMISLERTRDLVAEFIREQCFECLNKEVPFGVAVIIKSFKHKNGFQHIEANILVEKENHKGILIGQGGKQLKAIGQGARQKIEELLGEKIYLGLHIAYKKNWSHNKAIMKELGYVVDKK